MDISLDPREAVHGERFLRRAVSARRVYAVSCAEGLARQPSRRERGLEVTLLWSEPAPAQRWAGVLPSHARVKELDLDEFLAGMLPALAEHKRLVGLDWNEQAVEPEVGPLDLAAMLRNEMLESFLTRVIMFGAVWTLGDAYGPALLVSSTRAGDVLMLPCWSDERQAEARIEGPWSECVTMRTRLDDFLNVTLGWLERQGHLVAPEHMRGRGTAELDPTHFKLRLAARRVTGM
jgi:hypothetical protein